VPHHSEHARNSLPTFGLPIKGTALCHSNHTASGNTYVGSKLVMESVIWAFCVQHDERHRHQRRPTRSPKPFALSPLRVVALGLYLMGGSVGIAAMVTAVGQRRAIVRAGFVPVRAAPSAMISTAFVAAQVGKHRAPRSNSSPLFLFSARMATASIPSVATPLPSVAGFGLINRNVPDRCKNVHRNRPGAFSSRSLALAAVAAPPAYDDAPAPGRKRSKKQQSANKDTANKGQPGKNGANTGRLRRLLPVQPAGEILARARRQTFREVKDDLAIANQRRRAQKRGAQTIDLFSQKLCAPLKQTVQTYRRELRSMHPFEQVVMDLTVKARHKKDGLALAAILDDIHEGRKELLQLSKDWIAKIKGAPTARESFENTEEAKEVLGQVFLDLIDEPWGGVAELQRGLRNAPVVRLDCPAVVLVGAPNVGTRRICCAKVKESSSHAQRPILRGK